MVTFVFDEVGGRKVGFPNMDRSPLAFSCTVREIGRQFALKRCVAPLDHLSLLRYAFLLPYY